MATAIDQKAYLRKYLAGAPEEKKKKKKKNIKGKGFKIIDDDLDISKLRPLYGDELDVYNEGEDAPQVVGIIDERPEELRRMDEASLTKWKVINQDDGFNSNLKVEEIKKNRKEVEKENEITFGKMYSDSEDEEKVDSDFSPPRKNSKTKKKCQSNSDSDFSPPRRRNKSQSDSDASPPRKNNRYENSSTRTKNSKSVKQYDLDDSPPRVLKDNKSKHNKSSEINSKNSKRARKNYDSDFSPPRRSEKIKERVRRNSDSDFSPPRNKEKRYDSDFSPPRKNKKPKERMRKPSRWGHFEDQDTQNESSHTSRNRSPGSTMYKEDRYKNVEKSRRVSPKHKRTESWSPERNSRHKNNQEYSKSRDNQKNYRNKSPPSNKKMEKTLDGKQAGLQDADRLKEENEAFRLREEELFQNMTDDLSGRNAKAVSRKGKRETSEDRQKQTEKAERQKALDEKYKKWSKGLKQVEDQQAAFQDYMHEASKPLARYKDDVDLEDKLKDVDRDGDPMLKYIKDRRRERGELGPEKPSYKGNFPPNRFNIKPGYRWDGVDRSNGYEKKYFEQQSKKKAQAEEAYKWSTEDL